MPQKGLSKKSEYYLKDRSLEKPESLNESLRYKALENKVFYFDFKNTSTAAWLEKEIRKLGGRVEYFFGKEVQYLITDKPQTKDSIPPCSPFSNPGPSPFSRPDTSQSMRDVAPTPSEWAYSDQWKKPQSSQRSRASKMMELASVTKSQGSCDVWSRAKERGTTIKTVENFIAWLHTVHKKLGTKMSRDSLKEPPKNPSRKLRGVYMKVEDSGRKYKPQVLDDAQSWQTIDASALTDDSPFNTEKRRLTRKLANQQTKPTTNVRGILKKEGLTAKKKSGKGVIRKRGGGKCEGCNVRFEILEAHLTGDQHVKYAKKDKNFEAIDQLISEGLSLDSFLLELQSNASHESKVFGLTQTLSPQVKSDGSTEPLDVDGPCTRARKQKYNLDVVNQTPLAPETDLVVAGPSPKLSGVPELENNYYLRSTPRKLVGMLDEWDTRWDNVIMPDQVSQLSVVSDGTFLQCQSLDLYSSQGQIPVPTENPCSEFVVKRPRVAESPVDNTLLRSPGSGPVTRLRSPAQTPPPRTTRSKSPPRNTRSISPTAHPTKTTRSQSPGTATKSRSPGPATGYGSPESSHRNLRSNSPGRSRNNSAKQTDSPTQSRKSSAKQSSSAKQLNSPSQRRCKQTNSPSGASQSPNKRSQNSLPVKRRVINHS
ncbi:protein chiffon-like isoform X3 [Bolinopsis microptera]|uniref:protein chiffon-like isoform X3 n=1 Tax=Bolinopsis microptera TaxID=2820187 RepID=UPI003078D9F7